MNGTGRCRYTADNQRHLDHDPRVIEYREDGDGDELVFTYNYFADPTSIYKAAARQLHIDDLS